MEIVEHGPLTPELRSALEGDESDPFDSAGITLQYRRKERHVTLVEDGRPVASTGMLIVEVEVGERRFEVVGIGGVLVRAAYRGRGLGREIVAAALAKAATLGPEFTILFCHADRAGLYRKLGFTGLAGEVMVAQPDGYAAVPQLTMWRALRDGVQWPPGPVLVHSLPF